MYYYDVILRAFTANQGAELLVLSNKASAMLGCTGSTSIGGGGGSGSGVLRQ